MEQDSDSQRAAPGPEDSPRSSAPQTSKTTVRVKIGDTEHTGEVVLAEKWSADLALKPKEAAAEFRIVVLNTPSRLTARSIADPTVAVWMPSPAVAEEAAAYTAGSGVSALDATQNAKRFQRGRIYTNRGLAFRPASDLAAVDEPLTIEALGVYLMLDRADSYVRLLDENLPSLADTQALESNLRQFRLFQERSGQDLERTRSALAELSLDLGSTLAEADQRAQDHLLQLAGYLDPVAYGRVAEELYGGTAGLAADLETLRRLGRLARLGPEVRLVARYLDGVSLRPSDDELAVDRVSVREQLQLRALAARPEVWDSILDMFRWIKSRYTSLYLQHHRGYYRDIEEYYQALNTAARQVDAVRRLSAIPQLDIPPARDLTLQYQDMLTRARPCEVRELEESALEVRPTCPSCGLPLSAVAPVREAREYLAQLRGVLERQCGVLSAVVSTRIVRDRASDRLDRLIRVVQVSDLTSLANVLDDELVDLLADLLREHTA